MSCMGYSCFFRTLCIYVNSKLWVMGVILSYVISKCHIVYFVTGYPVQLEIVIIRFLIYA